MSIAVAISGPRTAKIRPLRAALLDIDGKRVAAITIVVDDTVPEVVMFRDEPFLLTLTGLGKQMIADGLDRDVSYRQVRPFRYDGGE